MDRFVFHNGTIKEASSAAIPATSAGVMYGRGIFTIASIHERRPFMLDRHFDRLKTHARKIAMDLALDFESLAGAAAELIEANRVTRGRLRITLLKGQAGAWGTGSCPGDDDLLMMARNVSPTEPRAITVSLSPHRILSSGPLAGIKRTSMLEHVLAFEEARGRGFDEAIILNESGDVVSCSTSNLFWVENDELVTPSTSTGCVAGITRALVHEIAQRIGVHAVEGAFQIQRVLDAGEVFLTSSSRGITPARKFHLREYGDGPGRLTRQIKREFERLVESVRSS